MERAMKLPIATEISFVLVAVGLPALRCAADKEPGARLHMWVCGHTGHASRYGLKHV